MQRLPTYHKWILFFAILLVAFGIATPVLADWLGPPDRKVTTTTGACHSVLYECREVNHRWKYKRIEDWDCSNESKPCRDYPDISRQCDDDRHDGGYQYCSSDVALVTTVTSLAPATITGSISCTAQNGWCRSGIAPELILHAQEPLPEHRILLVEGTLNGLSFACQSGLIDCNVPLSEGNNELAYWALSTFGDSTDRGTVFARVDTVSPNVGLDINGASGANGWYISPTTITAAGSDATSGVASALLSIDPSANPIQWQPSATLGEGVYNIAVEVADYAGNISDSSTAISVDITTPAINISVGGTAGNNGWYKSSIQVSALASDATSGVATFEVSADGTAYQNYTPGTAISFSDGHHAIRFKAVDGAGNRTETPLQEFYVDTLAPVVDLPASWQLGRNVPYSVQDDGSGLAALRIVIEDEDERYAKVAWNETVSGPSYSQDIDWNGQFKDKTVAPPGIYLVWIKASDQAGNEHFELGKVIVPEPNGILSFLPTEEPAVAAVPPAPPAELSETEGVPPVTAPPAQDFGGGATEPGEVTTQSLLLTSGTAGGIPASPSSSGVLWGAAAAALIAAATAYALEAARQRKEAEAEQAAQLAAEIARDKDEHAERLRRQQENWEEQQALEDTQPSYPVQIDLKIMRMEDEEGAALAQENSGQSFNRIANEDKRADRKDTLLDEQFKAFSAEPQDWQAAYDAYMAQRALESGTVNGRSGNITAGNRGTTTAESPSIWQNPLGWFQQTPVYRNLIDPYIVHPVTTWAQNTWNTGTSYVQQNIQPNLTLRNLVAILATTALTANGVQWVNNIANNPQAFDIAKLYADALIQEHYNKYPYDPENHYLLYANLYPYDAFSEGADVIETLAKIAAFYGDVIWQQNPLAQAQTQALVDLEKKVCTDISNQAWSNRCTATFYLLTGLNTSPLDTAQGVFDGLVFDPVVGVLKELAVLDSVGKFPELINAIREEGWKGIPDFELNLIKDTWETVSQDPQIQSAFFFEILILAAIIFAPLAGGIVLGTTINGLIDLDTAVTNAEDKQSLINFVMSHEVRTAVVSSMLILAMIGIGVGKKALDLRAFQDSMSPVAQWDFQNLSWLEQIRLADLAIKMNLSPGAVEFYLKQSVDSASGLAKLSVPEALRVSSFVDVYGEETMARILPFCERYGINPYELLTRSRAEGQSLFGLALGIEDPKNPINHPLLKLNLTEAELSNILNDSLKNPDSKVVVLGYGSGVAKPYYELGHDITASYISLSNEAWAPFDKARANFWVEINAPFIESAIKQRKIFLFNVEYDVIVDEANITRFSLPELRLIEMEQNNYMQIPVGEYTAFVPAELIDTYKQYLPPSLFGSGE